MTLFTLAQLISPYKKLLVGFSGGLDSTVLLHRLMLLRDQQPDLKLRAIHVHHGLSKYADDWVIHCKLICKEWNIPLIVEKVSLKNEGLGIEGQARKARYTAFAKVLLPSEALVTAQHINDQCETVLLALKRGSGPTGLSAMSAHATFAISKKQLRPQLNMSRSSLEDWASKYNLHWVEDESNQDISHDRNFLRLKVLPLFVKRWPRFAYAVSRSAQLCAEQENLLDELLAEELALAISKEGAISIAALYNKSTAHRSALLRRWLSIHQALMPSRNMVMRIWNEVASVRRDANPALYFNGFEIRRYQEHLWRIPRLPTLTDYVIFWTNLSKPLNLPYNIGKVLLQPNGRVRLPKENEQVTVRFNAQGTLHLVGRHNGRKIKKIWQECKVPPWCRRATPLLFYDEILIAAANEIFITQEGFTDMGVRFIWKQK